MPKKSVGSQFCGVLVTSHRSRLVMVKLAPRIISPEYDPSRDPLRSKLVADRAMVDYAETHPYAPTTTPSSRKDRVNYQNYHYEKRRNTPYTICIT